MSKVMNVMRRASDVPGVRRVLLHPPIRRMIAKVLIQRFAVAASKTSAPWKILWGEVAFRGKTRTYRLTSGLPVVFKHGQDMEALYEIHFRGEYEPPWELESRLRRDPLRVLDIGANVGMFSGWALARWPGCKITAFEPDPENLERLQVWASAVSGEMTVVPAAVSVSSGVAKFVVGQGGGSRLSSDEDEGMSVTTIDIFDYLFEASFVKMDIEGGEWAILTDPRLKNLRDIVIVMEYHRVNAPYLPAREAATELLTAAGFSTGYGSSNYWGHGTLWAWK